MVQVLSLPMRNWNTLLLLQVFLLTFCFEPTYEELKPICMSILINSSLVLSLPMRNWNFLLDVLSVTLTTFWAYLWGIETQEPYQIKYRAHSVLSLPMRNWNFPSWPSAANYCLVLSLPMRNWNKIDVKPFSSLPYMFWAYLWGIETRFT